MAGGSTPPRGIFLNCMNKCFSYDFVSLIKKTREDLNDMKIYQTKKAPTTKLSRKDKKKRAKNDTIKDYNEIAAHPITEDTVPPTLTQLKNTNLPSQNDTTIQLIQSGINKIDPVKDIIGKRRTHYTFSHKSNYDFTTMHGTDKTINFHSSPNTEDVTVDIVTETFIPKQGPTFYDHREIGDRILKKNDKEMSYNVNLVDLSKKEKVNVTLFQRYNGKEEVKNKVVEQMGKEDLKSEKQKRLIKSYQENSMLKGYESSVDVRYVVNEEKREEVPFFKRIFMKMFGKNE